MADIATASVDVVLVVLLLALAVGICRPDSTRASAAASVQPRQPTLSERALLLELTAALLLLVAWIRLVYAANDCGWKELMPQRCASYLMVRCCVRPHHRKVTALTPARPLCSVPSHDCLP